MKCKLFQTLAVSVAVVTVAIASADESLAPVLKVAQGFAVKRLYSVPRESQGSWISLAADRRGILYASDQYGPLHRIELLARQDGDVRVERLKLPLGGVHGLTFVESDLYAVVGQREICESGLYRLRDSSGDGELDTVEQLQALAGDGEHGPHAVVASADGQSLYVIAGNATRLPKLARSRAGRWGNDSLLPLPAQIGSETRGLSHGGWICRTDREGRQWELVCMGLRNAYDLACDRAGELFTFDSDTEFEIGLPWYRPTRVLHCVSGADFGWRGGALKVPEGSPDTLPSLAPLGLGSPTAVLFASNAAFPAKYRDALFVADWTFGRMIAVHLPGHYSREQQLHYARCLSMLDVGWTGEQRGRFFDWLGAAEGWRGGASFLPFLQRIRADALSRAPQDARAELAARMAAAKPTAGAASDSVPVGRGLVREWKLEELVLLIDSTKVARDAAHGRKWFVATGCARCHTFAGEGGAVGSDLTSVARRLSTRELLEAIIDPSKEISDQYGTVVLKRSDGTLVSGRVVNFNGGAVHVSENLFDPSAVTKVPEDDIESITPSKVSLMPAGLLNVLYPGEVLDLIAYLKSAPQQP